MGAIRTASFQSLGNFGGPKAGVIHSGKGLATVDLKTSHCPAKLMAMKREDHCRQSLGTFGRPWKEVHLWLDEFAGSERYGMRHRRVRHHEAGIREAARLFGPEAAAVARQHVIADLKEEGWTESDPFPRDERHYAALGLF